MKDIKEYAKDFRKREAALARRGLRYSNSDMVRLVTDTFGDLLSVVPVGATPKDLPDNLRQIFVRHTMRSKAEKLWKKLRETEIRRTNPLEGAS